MCLMCTGKAQPRVQEVLPRWIAPTLQPLHLSTNATGTHAAVVLGYGVVGWMNLDTGIIERTLSTGRYLPIVAVAQRGNLLMIADSGDLVSGDGVIDLWDTATWQRVRRMVSPSPIVAAALAPNGQYIAAVSRDRAVRLWRVTDNALLTTVYQAFAPLSVAFTADSTRVITGDTLGYLQM